MLSELVESRRRVFIGAHEVMRERRGGGGNQGRWWWPHVEGVFFT